MATFRSFDTSLTLPGTTQVDVNAVSGVTVLSTHRRRGLLSRWMDQELARAAASGQCASVLVASEAPIYGRFGYGPASSWCRWTIDARRARWRPDAPVARGSFRMVSGQEWAEIAPALHERVARRHPGAIGREQDLFRWIGGLVPDLSDENKGRRFLLHRDSDGAVDGAAVFSIGDGASWDDGATVKVGDLLAVDDVVERTIVGFLGDMDFITSVEVADQPASWSVPWGLVDTRAATSGPVRDALQVRLHDVPAALSAREYAVPGSVVLEVADPAGQAAGVYRLRVADDGTATCVRRRGRAGRRPARCGCARVALARQHDPVAAGPRLVGAADGAQHDGAGAPARGDGLAHPGARPDALLRIVHTDVTWAPPRSTPALRCTGCRTPPRPLEVHMSIPTLTALDALFARLASDNAAAALRAEAERRLAWRYEESEYLLLASLEGAAVPTQVVRAG